MAKIETWCGRSDSTVNKHRMMYFEADASKLADGVVSVADVVPGHYAAPARIARVLQRLGKPEAAEYVRAKLPTGPKSRSGDIGEILASSFVDEFTGYTVGVLKLRWKDHREMAMRGDDILAVRADPKLKLRFLKGEVKSRATLAKQAVVDARAALASNHGRPTPHALAFVGDRLFETGQTSLSDLIDDQLKSRVSKAQTSHMMFVFTGNDPSKLLAQDLAACTDTIVQRAVGVHVAEHQDFIKRIYERVLASGIHS